jgi:hypothetical protein
MISSKVGHKWRMNWWMITSPPSTDSFLELTLAVRPSPSLWIRWLNIGQLQDEVDFLFRQGEVMQTRLDARNASPNTSVQSHNEEVGSRPGTNEKSLMLDLNVTLEPPADEDSIKKEQ